MGERNDTRPPGHDHLGQRRLSTLESWWWYGLAFVSYVLLGVWHKWMLNWFVGPAWVLAIVWFGPALVDRLRPGAAPRRGHGDVAEDAR